MTHAPGIIRDSIINYLGTIGCDASTADITNAVSNQIGAVPASSVRSYLNINCDELFERIARGRYRLRSVANKLDANHHSKIGCARPFAVEGNASLFHADCFDWLMAQSPCSVHAIVTDPPYGLVEYSDKEQLKLKNGKGGVWRIPPSFDGVKRSPLPRFTTLRPDDLIFLFNFFQKFSTLALNVLVPGANVLIATNPLLTHAVIQACSAGGLEHRGFLARLVMTMRGGDRPKNAHLEFSDVSVMPRSMFEPWLVMRKPLSGRVQDNLRIWRTGGFRRVSEVQPFGDVIKSGPTRSSERKIAPHPSLKPQAFMRQIVRASLPLGKGTILDPFAGSGSTLAAANAVGYTSIGIELNEDYVRIAKQAIGPLSRLKI